MLAFPIIGVGYVLRKLGNTAVPTVELKKDGDKYTLTTSSTFKTTEITFELDTPFEEETMDGRKVTSVITIVGNKYTHKQDGNPPSEIVRDFCGNEMVTVMTCKDVTCTRKYVAQ